VRTPSALLWPRRAEEDACRFWGVLCLRETAGTIITAMGALLPLGGGLLCREKKG
jgi:hypothetical protein